MGIAENIKLKRLELGLSQQELADKMGYKTRSTIAKIESGENSVSETKIAKFAKALDTTAEYLRNGVEQEPDERDTRISIKNQSKVLAVILAGGKSIRNMQNIPNQFLNIMGKPVIIYSLETYEKHPLIDEIYVVCLKDWEGILKAYAKQYGITKLKGIVPAGETGVLSVKNGLDQLDKCDGDDIVILQESTRPLVTEETVSKLLYRMEQDDCVVVVERMKEYIQFIDSDVKKYVDRNKLVSLQSPEAYRMSTLREVFAKIRDMNYKMDDTTCAMMMYNLGYNLNFCDGSHNNLKIVKQEDIDIISTLIKQRELQ